MTSAAKPPVLVIAGATASGKSAVARALAEADPTIEIVNGDAFQLYKDIEIGTAQPTDEERSITPHHLFGVLSLNETLSAGKYADLAREAIRDILRRGMRPVVVGGSVFYLEALFYGLPDTSVAAKILEVSRARAKADLAELGAEEMYRRLIPIDAGLARQYEREQNPIRLIRAWEYYYATGKPLSAVREEAKDTFEYLPEFRILMPSASELRERIRARLERTIPEWLKEIIAFQASGIDRTLPGFRAIGYAELFDVLEGKLTLERAVELIEIRTAQYAKKQRTMLRRLSRMHPEDVLDPNI